MAQAMAQTRSWLAAAVVVGGLFLMHGMTADHSLPVPMAHGPVHAAVSQPAGSAAADDAGADHIGVAGSGDEANVLASGHWAFAAHPPSPADHSHGTAGACLALLAAVILMQVLGRRLPLRRIDCRAHVRGAESVTWGAAHRHPPWMRNPSSTLLCISRT